MQLAGTGDFTVPVEARRSVARMSVQHPVARGETPAFFAFCVALVLAWPGGYVVGAGASYEQATGSALTATTLLLVALLKNAELRSEHAIQSKLDAWPPACLRRSGMRGRMPG